MSLSFLHGRRSKVHLWGCPAETKHICPLHDSRSAPSLRKWYSQSGWLLNQDVLFLTSNSRSVWLMAQDYGTRRSSGGNAVTGGLVEQHQDDVLPSQSLSFMHIWLHVTLWWLRRARCCISADCMRGVWAQSHLYRHLLQLGSSRHSGLSNQVKFRYQTVIQPFRVHVKEKCYIF